MTRQQRGFSLLELMMVVAIIAIIAAVAIPQYSQYVRRAQRADAMAALTNVAAVQEKYYLQNNSYASSLTDLGLSDSSVDGYYTLKVTSGDADGFEAIAVPSSGSPQAADGQCSEFKIDNTGLKSATGDGGDTSSECWR